MRALVIDDSRATRALLRRIFGQLDAEVVDASDGQQGLDVLAAEQANGGIDVALVDGNMPANGYVMKPFPASVIREKLELLGMSG